jgi:hypothetical protein
MPPPPPPLVSPITTDVDLDDDADHDEDDDWAASSVTDVSEGFETAGMSVCGQASKFQLICKETAIQQPFFVLLKKGRPSAIRFMEGPQVPFGLAAFVEKQYYEHDEKGLLVPKPGHKDLALFSEYVKELGTGINMVRYVYRAHFSYRQTGPWFDWVWAVACNKRFPVRVYCFIRYTDITTGKAKAYAIVQGGDPLKNKIPKVNKTSALTMDFEIAGKRGKRSLGKEPCTYPKYRIIPCTDLQETCCVFPELKKKQDPLLVDPSACEKFLLVADFKDWPKKFLKFKMGLS